MLRSLFIQLSVNDTARRFVTNFGLARRMARRFVAGETVDEAIVVAKGLNRRGIKAVLNHVGESVVSPAEASQAAQEFQVLLRRIAAEKLEATISVKPSHLGLSFGRDFCYKNIANLVQTARQYDQLVEIDMEGSADVEDTLYIYRQLLKTFGGGARQAVQSYLYRTPADIGHLVEQGLAPNIRLVKGAYQEPPEIAYQDKEKINQATLEIMEMCLTPEALERGAYLALGSHDPVLIEALIRETEVRGIAKSRFEFQMLLGVRRDEQERLARLGYQVRVYVPYGPAWYPYFMRRLAERPANVLFIVRALFGR
jgi:proline dehydrogenase